MEQGENINWHVDHSEGSIAHVFYLLDVYNYGTHEVVFVALAAV